MKFIPNGTGKFRFWCQKVLPLVYDDSLSYYELLCKVVDYLNKTNEDVNNLGNLFNQLAEYVENYFDNLDVQEEINNKLDDMAESGELANIVNIFVHGSAVLNVALMVDTLSSSNLQTAIDDALDQTNYIYIPDGEYNVHLEISQDCTIYMAENCVLTTETDTPALYAHDCSINLVGGVVRNGADDNSRVPLTMGNGMLFFENCHDSSIVNLNSPYSKSNGVIWIHDCINFTLEQSTFKNMLRAGMFIWGHCKNVIVRNCHFENSRPIENQDYCYFVYTGAKLFTEVFIPVEGLIYENNYCETSADCGLDTHGASNVIIRNNTVLDTVCAITAYNDNVRVVRPNGWVMENILIENNYCESNRQIPVGTAYPHPFLFVGSANQHKQSEQTNYGTYNDYRNCTIRNNVFKTPNNYTDGAIFFDDVCRNLTFEDNVVDLRQGANRYMVFRRAMNFSIKRNQSVGTLVPILFFRNCYGEVAMNNGFRYGFADTHVSYIKGLRNSFGDYYRSPTVDMGDMFYQNGLKMSNSFGVRTVSNYADSVKTFDMTVSEGIATVENNVYIPYLALLLDGTTSAYIKDVIDFEHFSVVDPSGNPLADGTYSATLRAATLVDIE